MSLKASLLIIFFSILAYGLHAQIDSINKIEFRTLTRGAHKEVVIDKDCVSITKQGRSNNAEVTTKNKIAKGSWNSLLNTLNGISLSEISDYKSPTNKRAYDGAWHSSITIITKDGKTYGHSFDNEEPNEKFKMLMNTIISLMSEEDDN